MSAISDLSAAGVSAWLDDLSRDRLESGNLRDLVDTREVVGVTTNPTIFQNAITRGDRYAEQLHDCHVRRLDTGEAVRLLTTYDVRWACDVIRDVFDRTEGQDGRVSIEVDPRLAHKTAETIAEAKSLWWMVDRPNCMIKIPAMPEGLPAITEVLGHGISVNVTLIFSLSRYGDVIDAFMSGLERARDNGHDLSKMASVASFFVSRVDTEVDKRLEKIGTDQATALRGQAAIANARLAYELFEERLATDRWKGLAAAGAHPQRPLWASTGVKDPAYDDTRYVVDLVAPHLVNTMPEPTLQAVYDHGQIRGDTITGGYAEAHALMSSLAEAGIDFDDVISTLEREGVAKFEDSWTELLGVLRGVLDRS